MKKKEAIDILNACIEVLEVVKKRVVEIEDDKSCLYPSPHCVLSNSSAHIDVALSRIKTAVRWQMEAELEHNK